MLSARPGAAGLSIASSLIVVPKVVSCILPDSISILAKAIHSLLGLAAFPAIQKETCLPIIVGPSHATGRRDPFLSMSCASIVGGASGLMIEAHLTGQRRWLIVNRWLPLMKLKRSPMATEELIN